MIERHPVPTLRLLPRHARPADARHPWLFAGSISAPASEPPPDSEVRIEDADGRFVARGLINPNSSLRVRLYRWDDRPLDDDFWLGRIDRALALRRSMPDCPAPGGACRLINSEGDGLSGLTVDLYDRQLVVQPSSVALEGRIGPWIERIRIATAAIGHSIRWDPWAAAKEGRADDPSTSAPRSTEAPLRVVEDGLVLEIDAGSSQKTGLYLDQRFNHRRTAQLAPGRSVLDLFCHTAGFGLRALAAGASSLLAIDRSAAAIERARANAELNGLAGASFEVAEVAPAVRRLRAAGRRFGLVVCDPPKFTRTARQLDQALRGYVQLNRSALDLVEPGGFLVTCSCSGHVGTELFDQVVARAAELARREVRIVERRGAAPDHPIAASCLESDYLKCYILAVT